MEFSPYKYKLPCFNSFQSLSSIWLLLFKNTRNLTEMRFILAFLIACGCSTQSFKNSASASDECSLTPVIHVLQYPGCVPKPIPSFACIGKCGSYVQVWLENIFLLDSLILFIFCR